MSDGTPIHFSGQTGASPPAPARDVLNYVADMLCELQEIATQQRCERLARLLTLSVEEARVRAEAESPAR